MRKTSEIRASAHGKAAVTQRLLKGALTPERDALTALLVDSLEQDAAAIEWQHGHMADFGRVKLRQIEAEQRADMLHYLATGEHKGLTAVNDETGGVMLPAGFHGEVIDAAARAWPVRVLCRNISITAASVEIAVRGAQLTDAEWTTMLGSGSEDASAPYQRVVVEPQFLIKRIKVSRALLRAGGKLAEEEIIGAITDATARPIEAALISGNGMLRPVGLLNTPGVPATVTTTTGQLAIADVKRWIGGLAGRYHAGATALMHVDSYSALLELDTNGALFQNGQLVGRYPIALSDEFPSAGTNPASLTPGTTIAVLGDFSTYWVFDSLFEVQRLMELYAETHEVGFIARTEIDAVVTRPLAFRALTVKP